MFAGVAAAQDDVDSCRAAVRQGSLPGTLTEASSPRRQFRCAQSLPALTWQAHYCTVTLKTMAQPQDAAADAAGAASTTEQQGQDEEIAAQMIQRNYRGYRERRQLQGIGLDASARWAEVRSAQKGTQVSSQ
jgi:hypothetical protein